MMLSMRVFRVERVDRVFRPDTALLPPETAHERHGTGP